MAIKVLDKVEKQDITMLQSGPWEIRNDCSARGKWKFDKDQDLGTAQLDMIVLGYTTLYGIVPAIQGLEDLEKQLKLKGIDTKGFELEDFYQAAHEKIATYWGYVLFVPAPTAPINPQLLPAGVVCGCLVKSTGLNRPGTGLIGNKGYFDQLQMSGLTPQSVITTASIEVTHNNPATGADVNGVVWRYRLPSGAKEKEEKALIASVGKFLDEHGSQLSGFLPRQTLRQCQEVDILKATQDQRLMIEAEVMNGAFSFAPELNTLPPMRTLDALVEVDE